MLRGVDPAAYVLGDKRRIALLRVAEPASPREHNANHVPRFHLAYDGILCSPFLENCQKPIEKN
jgi:hypothetical protein